MSPKNGLRGDLRPCWIYTLYIGLVKRTQKWVKPFVYKVISELRSDLALLQRFVPKIHQILELRGCH